MSGDILVREVFYYGMFRKHDAVMLMIDPQRGVILDANEAAGLFYGYALPQRRALTIQDLTVLPAGEIQRRQAAALCRQRNYFLAPHRLANGDIRIVGEYSSPVELPGSRLLFSIICDAQAHRYAGPPEAPADGPPSICSYCTNIRDEAARWQEAIRPLASPPGK